MLFNSKIHGYQLMSLYWHCINHHDLVILVKSSIGEVFGAFVSTIGHDQHWRHFLQDPAAFVFVLKSNTMEVAKTEYKERALSVLPTKDSLSIGYDNVSLLFMGSNLKNGFSSECKELKRPPLCSQEDGNFEIEEVEVWTVESETVSPRKKRQSIHEVCGQNINKLSTVLFGGRQHNHAQYASFNFK